MQILILGAGVIGISTAWHLLQRGHQVTVVDRQCGPALEASFANGAQISVSYCEPWANRDTPLKALKWMLHADSPLLFRPQLDAQQWRWSLQFLGQCNDRAFERNVAQLVELGRYSHAALREVYAATGITCNRLERGIAHYYTDAHNFAQAAQAAQVMARYGVQRRVVDRAELLRIEPALSPFAEHIVGGTYTPSDESGDCQRFTQALADRCAALGAELIWGHQVDALSRQGRGLGALTARPSAQWLAEHPDAQPRTLRADAVVVACGSYSAPLLRGVGVDLPIYPGKGYSATLPILRPEAAPSVSMIDDSKKIAISRLGDHLRVAGTIELGGFDLRLDSRIAKARCQMLTRRIEQVLPGVCDTRPPEAGGQPAYWCGLRPATPTNIPYIGATPLAGLWVNAGHGTLGWTHAAGSGRLLAALFAGERPMQTFKCYGFDS